jgi:hypothetical protein
LGFLNRFALKFLELILSLTICKSAFCDELLQTIIISLTAMDSYRDKPLAQNKKTALVLACLPQAG